MTLTKPKRVRDPKYLAWIRQQPCLSCKFLKGSVEAHHVRQRGKGGIGTKPNDRRAVPLCYQAHKLYHSLGRDSYELNTGIDFESEIKRLNAEYDKLNQKPARQRQKILIEHCICGKKHVLYSCPVEKEARA